MRGELDPQSAMFHYFSAEQRVPRDHPLRGEETRGCGAADSMTASRGEIAIATHNLYPNVVHAHLTSLVSEPRPTCINHDHVSVKNVDITIPLILWNVSSTSLQIRTCA